MLLIANENMVWLLCVVFIVYVSRTIIISRKMNRQEIPND